MHSRSRNIMRLPRNSTDRSHSSTTGLSRNSRNTGHNRSHDRSHRSTGLNHSSIGHSRSSTERRSRSSDLSRNSAWSVRLLLLPLPSTKGTAS